MSAVVQNRSWLHMECEPAERCALCGNTGEILHNGVKDFLWGAEGTWDVRRCSDKGCGLVWIDPMPLKSELWKAYSNYYTHRDAPAEHPSSTRHKRWAYTFYESTLALTPIARQRRELTYMFLDRVKPGRLLELGCGDGTRLALFRDAGWTVEGVEVDAEAAKLASTKHRVTVRHGELRDLHYPDEQFDAVVMNHVIEHVHDPLALISECCRLLRPGGTFIAVTPNSDSFGYSRFKQYWVGLDPPRHLHVFNPRNLFRLVQPTPAAQKAVWTSAANAELFCGWSLRVVREQQKKRGLLQRVPQMFSIAALQYAAARRYVFNRHSGEECVLRLIK